MERRCMATTDIEQAIWRRFFFVEKFCVLHLRRHRRDYSIFMKAKDGVNRNSQIHKIGTRVTERKEVKSSLYRYSEVFGATSSFILVNGDKLSSRKATKGSVFSDSKSRSPCVRQSRKPIIVLTPRCRVIKKPTVSAQHGMAEVLYENSISIDFLFLFLYLFLFHASYILIIILNEWIRQVGTFLA